MEEAEKVKALCEKLGEKDLLGTIDSFVLIQRELSTKKGGGLCKCANFRLS